MIRNLLREKLKEALNKAGYTDTDPEILATSDSKFGDYYSTIALKLKEKSNKQTLEATAKFIEAKIPKDETFFTTEVAPNGFINFKISDNYLQSQVQKIIEEDEDYGRLNIGKGKKVRVEFVSANPTGPLHIGNARGGPLGDTIASVLEFSGYQVIREYLNNNVGGQIEALGATIAKRMGYYRGVKPVKEKEPAYQGNYIEELAAKVKKQIEAEGGDKKYGMLSTIDQDSLYGSKAAKIMFEEIIADLKAMGIEYDKIAHEDELQTKLPDILKVLENKQVIKKYEGAVWFAPKDESLKDKDAVVVKSDGSYTYFAGDIVYHKEKFESGADLVIDVFGSNTSGHVPKLRAAVAALGFDAKKLKTILYQFVRVKKGNEIVRMSKRAGDFVTAREVLDEVGKDAFRFTLLMYDPNTHMDFDLEQAKKQSEENPVYYVQYAHARCVSILKKAQGEDFDLRNLSKQKLNLLNTSSELYLIRKLIKFPELVEDIVSSKVGYPVHLWPLNTLRVADELNRFYEQERVLGEEKEVSYARLALILATKIVLRNSLQLMGISAPEYMEKA
ncbi:MAG: arginine--tRNA ligase [bacterium]|nr:arginine--tRNA ligase [bacterium]